MRVRHDGEGTPVYKRSEQVNDTQRKEVSDLIMEQMRETAKISQQQHWHPFVMTAALFIVGYVLGKVL